LRGGGATASIARTPLRDFDREALNVRSFSQLCRAIAILVAAWALPALGQQLAEPKSTTLVTVTGDITRTNRGPYDEARDAYFKHLGIVFTKAAAFDAAMLASMAQRTVRTDFPKGGKVRSFTGPLLADVLAAAGAAGSTATITAMDGYAAELPIDDIKKFGVILALTESGKPLGIGDTGPAWVIFPRLDNPALKGRNDDGWVWAVVAISVK
jgi:hypothetical protein